MSQRNINYHLKDTWDQKYRALNFENTEWVDSAQGSIKALQEFLPEEKSIKILELGCGTSGLAEKLLTMGYQNITCLDFSKQVIKHKRSKNKQISYILFDFTQPFSSGKFVPEDKFDLIIDKGSLDCICCMQDSVRPYLKAVLNCYSNLKEEGQLLSLSLGHPKQRKYWLRNKLTPFKLDFQKVKSQTKSSFIKGSTAQNVKDCQEEYYLYVCQRVPIQDLVKPSEGIKDNMDGVDWNEAEEEKVSHAEVSANDNEQQSQGNSYPQISKEEENEKNDDPPEQQRQQLKAENQEQEYPSGDEQFQNQAQQEC